VSELRKDPITDRWVIISTERRKRPNDFQLQKPAVIIREEHCPFCAGREAMTPHEVLAFRNGHAPLFDRMNGIGAHEVIIETPDHGKTMATMSEPEIERVLWAYRERVLDLKNDRRFRFIVIFKNHGAAAGASLEHTHSQLIALPIVPDFVREEIDGARQHYRSKERCVYCDIVRQEVTSGRRIIQENADIVGITPYASRFPFEVWLLPRHHAARFEESPRQVYENLARMLKWVLVRMNKVLESPPFNFIIHSSPFSEDTNDYYHWHMEIIPKLTRVAGFEWGTGFHINPTAPEEAADVLRSGA
jgi:UDPglucose--hexose-1-phosphate uridylyltransferase